MKLTKALLLIAALSIFAAGCGNTATTNQPANTNANARAAATPATAATAAAAPAGEFQAARNTYAQFCVNCHRPDGSGGPREFDGKKLDVPSLREGPALKDTDEEFAEQIANGGDGMPAFKNRLDAERINGLVRFIRHEFQGKTAAAAGNVNKPMPAPAH